MLEIEPCATPFGGEMHSAAIAHWHERRDCAERVPRREVHRDGRVAERELLPVVGDHVALRLAWQPCAGLGELPVNLRKNDAGSELLLQVFGATDMVDVGVAYYRIFEPRRIEPKLAQATFHLVGDRIVPDRVDEDDPVRGVHRPSGIFLLADEVEIVEYLYRLDVPG